jgi:meso-butanediol dehydrogenase/(S,S)-butanediol dehydrogenase/diacetyl reductase
MTVQVCTRFKNKVALVIGAASGIGAATSKRLAAEGASVVLSDKNGDGAEEIRASLPYADRHMALLHDVYESSMLSLVMKGKAQERAADFNALEKRALTFQDRL